MNGFVFVCIWRLFPTDLNSPTRSTQLRPTGWWRDLKSLRLLPFSESNPSSWAGVCTGGKRTNKKIDHEETLQVNIIKEYYLLLLRPHLPFLFPAQFAELYPEDEVWWKIIFFNAWAQWNFLNPKSIHFVLAFFSKGWASIQPERPCEHAWHCLEWLGGVEGTIHWL